MSDAKKKKAQPARPKLQTPAPKKRTPVKRKAEHADAIRSVTPPTSPSPLKNIATSLTAQFGPSYWGLRAIWRWRWLPSV